MKQLIERFAALVNVKTLVTLVVIFVFAVLALRGEIDANTVMNVVFVVVSFYFGTQYEKNGKSE